MCGIVGVVSGYNNGFSQPEVDALTRMLFIDTFRGWDSTGVFGGDKDGNVQVLKEASTGPDFIASKEYKEFTNKLYSSGKFVVGHNRAATRGTVNDKNAHPFWVDEPNKKLVLVQNGTWLGDHKHIKDTEVDTEALLHLLATEENVQAAINKVSAAYALVWYDVLEKQLHFLRNDQRPLFIAIMKSRAVLFASEWETIEYAVNKNGWKYENEPFMLKADNLWTLTFDKDGSWKGSEQEVKKIYTPPATVYGGGRAAGTPFQESQEPWSGTNGWKRPDTIEERARRTTHGSPSEYKHTFLDAFRPSGKGDLLPLDQFDRRNEIMEAGYNFFSTRKRALVEAFDYFPANDHPQCSVFHIVAKLVAPLENTPLDHIVCFWTLHQCTEGFAMGYVGRGFYNVDFEGITTYKTAEGYIFAARCSNAKLVVVDNASTVQN